MRGLVINEVGDPFRVTEGIGKPTPQPDQILVKSVMVAINPLDGKMQARGVLIEHWPCVLGCDAGGIVEAVGSAVKNFRVGDKVCGCTRIGLEGYATYQDYFLMDERLTLKVPPEMTLEQACTIGSGGYTAALGLALGLKVEFPDTFAVPRDEWILIFGGACSVGQYTIQLAKIAGYKVLASCSPNTRNLCLSLGADDTFSYREDEATQIANIKKITGGNFSKIYDAVTTNHDLSFKLFNETSTSKDDKYFSTTDNWTPIPPPPGINVDRIRLGFIGREDTEQNQQMNDVIAAFIPKLYAYFDSGALKPQKTQPVEANGYDGVLEGLEAQKKVVGGLKVVACIAV